MGNRKVGWRGTEAERFWRKVEKTATCWNWTGAILRSGYGHFGLQGRPKLILAHRWAYQQVNGPIPVGLTLDHACRNRRCVNPSHLEAVPHRTNVLRGIGPTAQNARKKRCKRGHLLQGDNLKVYKDGRRECRQCTRDIRIALWRRKYGKGKWQWKNRKVTG